MSKAERLAIESATMRHGLRQWHKQAMHDDVFVENGRLRVAIQAAIDLAGNHVGEWGERAEACFAILENALVIPSEASSE